MQASQPIAASHSRFGRRSHRVLAFVALLLVLFVATFIEAAVRPGPEQGDPSARLVRQLGLTDLALFTEARYTRHPSQADLNTPFQDHPLGLEHFPSGSLLAPPDTLASSHENLDKQTNRTD